jgi:sRNA-binding regulator protein Hfq
MAKTLAQWRKEKRMKAGQLASKSGVPIQDIVAYEKGEAIRLEHLSRLAKASYVNEMDILVQPPPRQKSPSRPPPSPSLPKTELPAPVAAERPTVVVDETTGSPQRKKSRWKKSGPSSTKPARESQLNHLLMLAQKQGEDETAVANKIGKPLAELTEREAGEWLTQYTESVKLYKAAHRAEQEANRPPGTRRRRYHLPEGVDEFEFNYLQARQEAEEMISFTLFDGQKVQGKIVGFSPYQIAIEQADGTETMLHKLAIAYYTVSSNR